MKKYLIIVAIAVLLVTSAVMKHTDNEESFDRGELVDSDISYTGSREMLVNPYKGYYELDSIVLPEYYEVDPTKNEENKKKLLEHATSTMEDLLEDKESLGLFLVYLDNYRETRTLPKYYLGALNEYLDVYRKAGNKAIVRFAYGKEYESGKDINNDPSDFSIILGHLEQLRDFFETNQDVIHTVQLGFIGPWGEMHSSVYAETEYINQLVDKALEVVPKEIQLALRRPSYYRGYVKEDSFFDEALGYTYDKRARIGLFNDAFLSSSTDKGTYASGKREEELEWQSYLTKYTISGGEHSYSESTYVDSDETFFEVEEAISNMEAVHMNYLHCATAIKDFWKKTQISANVDAMYAGMDAYTYFANRLGYRFLVKEAKVPGNAIHKGGILNFETSILNEGFGNLIQCRKVYVIIEKDGKYYQAITDKNPSIWWSGEVTKETFSLQLPSDIEEGEWNIYLYLPDSSERYEGKDNAVIKFANKGCYSAELQANYIGKFTIKGTATDTNQGFYQLGGKNTVMEEKVVIHMVKRPLVIDGTITNSSEWQEEEKVYQDSNSQIYVREDDENIYILAKTNQYLAKDCYVHISFSTDNSPSANTYEYMVENGRIYNGSYDNEKSNVDSDSKTSVISGSEDCFEYQIPKTRIKIKELEDVTKIKVSYINKDWDKLLTFEAEI